MLLESWTAVQYEMVTGNYLLPYENLNGSIAAAKWTVKMNLLNKFTSRNVFYIPIIFPEIHKN